MIIPWQELEPETLRSIAESVVLREGTDYGFEELSLEQKVQRLLTIYIKNKNDFLGNA